MHPNDCDLASFCSNSQAIFILAEMFERLNATGITEDACQVPSLDGDLVGNFKSARYPLGRNSTGVTLTIHEESLALQVLCTIW